MTGTQVVVTEAPAGGGGEEGMRGIDPAEGDWGGVNEEGANKISPGGTFSDAALALPFRRTATSAS